MYACVASKGLLSMPEMPVANWWTVKNSGRDRELSPRSAACATGCCEHRHSFCEIDGGRREEGRERDTDEGDCCRFQVDSSREATTRECVRVSVRVSESREGWFEEVRG